MKIGIIINVKAADDAASLYFIDKMAAGPPYVRFNRTFASLKSTAGPRTYMKQRHHRRGFQNFESIRIIRSCTVGAVGALMDPRKQICHGRAPARSWPAACPPRPRATLGNECFGRATTLDRPRCQTQQVPTPDCYQRMYAAAGRKSEPSSRPSSLIYPQAANRK